jgi:hypothetical protein
MILQNTLHRYNNKTVQFETRVVGVFLTFLAMNSTFIGNEPSGFRINKYIDLID